MPRPGDPATRPAEGAVVMATTPALEQQAAFLQNNAAIVWLGGRRPRVAAADIANVIHSRTHISKEFFVVIPHYPEDFFITFKHQHHRDAVTAAPGRILEGELDIRFSNWSPRAHADAVKLRHHVHLCLENVPLNAWNEEVAGKLIGGAAVTHYFDAATTQKEDASSLNLWAWTANPSAIPKVMWLTLIGGNATGSSIIVSSSEPLPGFNSVAASSSSTQQQGRLGLTYRVIVHLDLHEDFGQDASTPRYQHQFDWQYGIIDGEVAIRESNQGGRHNNGNDRRRRDDDDDKHRRDRDDADRRGRPDERQGSWSDRFFRSRSRAVEGRRDREDDGMKEGMLRTVVIVTGVPHLRRQQLFKGRARRWPGRIAMLLVPWCGVAFSSLGLQKLAWPRCLLPQHRSGDAVPIVRSHHTGPGNGLAATSRHPDLPHRCFRRCQAQRAAMSLQWTRSPPGYRRPYNYVHRAVSSSLCLWLRRLVHLVSRLPWRVRLCPPRLPLK
ncbi:uncharacterized protein LOC119331724 [Triticum dicoccoides]|uniref:uncharacterized protein LOC119331724 n=1 Tax=Triticum dicoccoides TaxID=85692 RepID=UPI001890C637|nr:uncharacterized protein LOC119331724 [Triticum dicoccoides]